MSKRRHGRRLHELNVVRRRGRRAVRGTRDLHVSGRRDYFDRRDEPIPAARQCLDEARIRRRVVQRVSQAADRVVQAVIEFDERIRRPQRPLQLLAGDDAHRVFDEQLQHPKRLVRHPNPQAALTQLTSVEVSLERAETQRVTTRAVGHADSVQFAVR
jgi:hypothetical protein